MSSHRCVSRAASFTSDPELAAIRTLGQRVSCDLTALRLAGIPEEFLNLICEPLQESPRVRPSRDGLKTAGRALQLLEDPDLRPYLWDLEEPCP